MKSCCTCKAEKPLTDFSRDASKPDGLRGQCRACKAATDRRYKDKYPWAVAEGKRRWDKANPEKRACRSSRWYRKNRERALQNMRALRARHPERGRDSHRTGVWFSRRCDALKGLLQSMPRLEGRGESEIR